MKHEKFKEQIKKDLKEGNPIIRGSMEEAKEIGEITDELEEEGSSDE